MGTTNKPIKVKEKIIHLESSPYQEYHHQSFEIFLQKNTLLEGFPYNIFLIHQHLIHP